MSFFSTRGGACATASQAILRGLANDGGLFVPSMFPQITQERLSALSGTSYQNHAGRILRSFLEDYSIAEIEEAVQAAYDPSAWDDHTIAPVKTLEPGLHVLELFHGPTLAFKDIALKLLPHLVRMAAEKNDEKREVSILVATSGDTGKAALEGFKDVPGTSCSVFYPYGGVSRVQELQMVTTGGDNTHVIGVKGNFDDAQTGGCQDPRQVRCRVCRRVRREENQKDDSIHLVNGRQQKDIQNRKQEYVDRISDFHTGDDRPGDLAQQGNTLGGVREHGLWQQSFPGPVRLPRRSGPRRGRNDHPCLCRSRQVRTLL